MAEGIVVSTHLASRATEPMRGVAGARAVPGRGLWRATVASRGGGHPPAAPTPSSDPGRRGATWSPGVVDLSGLVGEVFRVGEVQNDR